MTSATIVRATPAHARDIKLRESDLREMELSAPGRVPNDVLHESIEVSTQAYAAVDEEGVVAIGGFTDLGLMVVPWLLASDSLQRHRKQLLRVSRAFVDDLRKQFPKAVIGNHVDRGNQPARAFLQSLGAVITRTPGNADFDFFFFPTGAPHV